MAQVREGRAHWQAGRPASSQQQLRRSTGRGRQAGGGVLCGPLSVCRRHRTSTAPASPLLRARSARCAGGGVTEVCQHDRAGGRAGAPPPPVAVTRLWRQALLRRRYFHRSCMLLMDSRAHLGWLPRGRKQMSRVGSRGDMVTVQGFDRGECRRQLPGMCDGGLEHAWNRLSTRRRSPAAAAATTHVGCSMHCAPGLCRGHNLRMMGTSYK